MALVYWSIELGFSRKKLALAEERHQKYEDTGLDKRLSLEIDIICSFYKLQLQVAWFLVRGGGEAKNVVELSFILSLSLSWVVVGGKVDT